MEEVKNFPNLLIIGAAKSGTTSLHNYLKQHPDFFMSDHKEPHFLINNEIGVKRIHKAVTTLSDYQEMFEGSSYSFVIVAASLITAYTSSSV